MPWKSWEIWVCKPNLTFSNWEGSSKATPAGRTMFVPHLRRNWNARRKCNLLEWDVYGPKINETLMNRKCRFVSKGATQKTRKWKIGAVYNLLQTGGLSFLQQNEQSRNWNENNTLGDTTMTLTSVTQLKRIIVLLKRKWAYCFCWDTNALIPNLLELRFKMERVYETQMWRKWTKMLLRDANVTKNVLNAAKWDEYETAWCRL